MRSEKRTERGRIPKAGNPATPGGRTFQAMVAAGHNQQSLAKVCGLSVATINKIIHDKSPDSKHWITVAKALNTSAEYLKYGIVPNAGNSVLIIQHGKVCEIKTNKENPPFDLGVPNYPWEFDSEINEYNLPQTQFIKGGSRRTISLIVEDDINISPDSSVQDFHKGDIIYIDRDLSPVEGDFVLARIKDELIFRQYVKAMGKHWLRPLNTQFPAIPFTRDIEIIGVHYATLWYAPSFHNRRKANPYFKKKK